MNAEDYEEILTALAAASRVLQSSEAELNAADLRIRCLVNITAKEAKRALLELSLDARARKAAADAPVPVMREASAL